MDSIRVQSQPFSAAEEYAAVATDTGHCGAVVMFTGHVRGDGDANPVVALELEHYPGMTEQVLEQLLSEARKRWQLGSARIVHRVGKIALGEEIVLVVVASAHRREAFAAAEFLMDKLKTEAPFWKKEHRADASSAWVEAKTTDQDAAGRWL